MQEDRHRSQNWRIGVIDELLSDMLTDTGSGSGSRPESKGRGFAVVAGEVRNLALAMARRHKRSKGLIEESQVIVSTG